MCFAGEPQMPHIYDNIDLRLVDAVRDALGLSKRADFCIGYFNLRGWKHVADLVETWPGDEDRRCRLLIGMQSRPDDDLRDAFRVGGESEGVDQAAVVRARREYAKNLRRQLTFAVPTADDEAALQRLRRQLLAGKVVVKLHLRHQLHAKLYLMFRNDPVNPVIGYVGSSNLTLAGLVKQGELNVDVLDSDAVGKLARWFEDRWNDRWCLDISNELAEIIGQSWAREDLIPPYHIYLKMAYHLSEEARQGIADFRIPSGLGILRDHQRKAVQIAAGHLNRRRGVLIGDVVGLGKTLIGTAVARIFEDDRECETLILCPKNLVRMWEDHRSRYGLRGAVLSTSVATRELSELRRYRLVLIDESHNLRNRETKLYRAIADYIERNESFCILMTATPYNMAYQDLCAQLRLFIRDEDRLPIRPEALLRRMGETEFARRHQCAPDSILAFEQSDEPDDWREVLRRYMVRRTRSFIIENYATADEHGRHYLQLEDGSRSYFPKRLPRAVKCEADHRYAALYDDAVVDIINHLGLPRYGLGLYVADPPPSPPTKEERAIIANLSRAGRRLMGFCRTNLFKRLESSGHAFLLSLRRHILRNELFIHALSNDLPLPIGTQDPAMLDVRVSDAERDTDEPADNGAPDAVDISGAEMYERFRGHYATRFRWIRAAMFDASLCEALLEDNRNLAAVLDRCPRWDAASDSKLAALVQLVTRTHAKDKVLIFSQFADTVGYLADTLTNEGVKRVAGVTGSSSDPTAYARRFSPVSNNTALSEDQQIRVLVATDVLSEGQNLQDAHVVVSYDLPWAIIRLIQRAGRVDRIGQEADTIYCYSFYPADGVETLIRLRSRLRDRLRENAEVVGTDERFFDDDRNDKAVADLYNEKAGILDDEEDEVDLASRAYEIWSKATAHDPELRRAVESLPAVVYATKSAEAAEPSPAHQPPEVNGDSALVYLQTSGDHHALAWIGPDGNPVTHSALRVLEAAACEPDTPPLPRSPQHHHLVAHGVQTIIRERRYVGGQLGRPSGARYRTYERLRDYAGEIEGTLLAQSYEPGELQRAIEDIYRYPLTSGARDALNRQLRSGIGNEGLADMVVSLRRDGRLSTVVAEGEATEASVICSMGLRTDGPAGARH